MMTRTLAMLASVAFLLALGGCGWLFNGSLVCTITVQPGESIQAAIDAVSPGDVICLSPGEWEENLVIEKSLTLRAAGIVSQPQAGIRSAREDWPVIRIVSEEPIEVTVQGLKITGAFGWCYREAPEWICADGISVHGKATATIENNIISDNRRGIQMRDSSQAAIENNTISDNRWGIQMRDSSQATIEGNTVSHNSGGIAMFDSSQATIEGNTISGNSSFDGIEMWDSSQVTIENNTISGNRSCGIKMWDSSQATIEGNTISGNRSCGIKMWDSSQATIENNTISNNRTWGIEMWVSSQVTIENNTISDNLNRPGIVGGSTV